MKQLFKIDLKDYDESYRRFRRPSVRGVIITDNKVAMVYSVKHDYYKFPGGGIENDEDHIETLKREVLEETGLTVLDDSIRELGSVVRIQKSRFTENEIFEQENFYYLCDVEASLKRKGKNAYVTVPIKSTHYVVHYNVEGNPLVSIIMIDCNKNSIKNNLNIIEEMIGYVSQDEIGVVGPKIYNYGKLIKSAGLILSNKNIYIDAFNNYFTDSYGLYGRLLVPYNYSALSDVFLMFSKRKYNEVNGFRNDVDFTLSSIDFCLKLLKKNYQNVLLSHLFVFQKDFSRKERYELSDDDKLLFLKDWNLYNDIYYNKNLSKTYGFMLDCDGDKDEN